MEEAGAGLELEFLQKFTDQTLTSTGTAAGPPHHPPAADDPWYSALAAAFTKHGLKVR